ncbi:MAG: hypothetical protein PHC44_04680 [Lutispora sp.]|nr:hypothetical protein [Lutispora sp.]
MIDKKYIVAINGKPFITYEGLLHAAHEKGLGSIEVEIIQYPTEENNMTAVTTASVRGKDGQFFIDIGDASPASCVSKLVPHLLRISSTRAKARALRDLTDVGMCSLEELGESETNLRPVASPIRQQFAK